MAASELGAGGGRSALRMSRNKLSDFKVSEIFNFALSSPTPGSAVAAGGTSDADPAARRSAGKSRTRLLETGNVANRDRRQAKPDRGCPRGIPEPVIRCDRSNLIAGRQERRSKVSAPLASGARNPSPRREMHPYNMSRDECMRDLTRRARCGVVSRIEIRCFAGFGGLGEGAQLLRPHGSGSKSHG